MNAKQRRKDRRANPGKYWTGAEVDAIAERAAELQKLFGGSPANPIRFDEIVDVDGVAFYRNLAGELVELPF